jgi:L-lysine exporter family protein LysE/ArgO
MLAWRIGREVIHPKHVDVGLASGKKSPAGVLLMKGAGLALASPTSIAWFAAVGGSVIATFGGDRLVLLPFALGFFAGTALWAVAFPYSVAAVRTIASEKLVRVLSFVSAVMFVYFACVVFINGVREFL